jgi:hypothetical protein
MSDKLRRVIDAYQIVGTDPDGHKFMGAFYARVDLLRPAFGKWDACDPVAHAILDAVEAQTELADAISDYVDINSDEAAIEAAKARRRAAGERLTRLISETDRANPE